MTVSDIPVINSWSGNGTNKEFDFDFRINKQCELKVYLLSNPDTVLVNGTDYKIKDIVDNGEDYPLEGGTIEFPLSGSTYDILTSSDKIVLKLNLPFTQEKSFSQGGITGTAIEECLDDNVRMMQLTQQNVSDISDEVDTANATASMALLTANNANAKSDTAISTANTASSNASTAVSTANSANTKADNAVSTANTASTNASNAVSTANTASTNASSAVSTASTANTNASNAVSTANSALSKANTAISTANTASTNASNAVSTANSASSTANTALSTANTASTNASNAVSTANSASSTATAASNKVDSFETDIAAVISAADKIDELTEAVTTATTAAGTATQKAQLASDKADIATQKAQEATQAASTFKQSDWNETDTTDSGFIKNKPTIPTVPTALSSFNDDLGSSPTHTHSQYLTSHQDISGKEDITNKGVANGYAELDDTGKVPTSQLPELGSTVVITNNTVSPAITDDLENIKLYTQSGFENVSSIQDNELNFVRYTFTNVDLTSYETVTTSSDLVYQKDGLFVSDSTASTLAITINGITRNIPALAFPIKAGTHFTSSVAGKFYYFEGQ